MHSTSITTRRRVHTRGPTHRPRARAGSALAVAVALLLSACGSSDESTDDPEAAPTSIASTATTAAVATTEATDESTDTVSTTEPEAAVPEGPTVSARPGDALLASSPDGDFTPIDDGPEPVEAGNVVRTVELPASAEISWTDGALTRLQSSTDFEVLSVPAGAGASVGGRLIAGTIWHRVSGEAAVDTLTVETPLGTATAGAGPSALVVSCNELGTVLTCGFGVVEGSLLLTSTSGNEITVEAGKSVSLRDGAEPLSLPLVPRPPSVEMNLALDERAGFDVVEDPNAIAPANCVMNGSTGGGWPATFTDAPVSRGVYILNGEPAGFSFGYRTPGDPLEISINPSGVTFFGEAGSVSTSVNDGGTYDFAPDGTRARVVDDRPGQLDIPAAIVDVTIECDAPA